MMKFPSKCHTLVIVPDSLYSGKWGKNQSHVVTLTLIWSCPMSNSSEIFSCIRLCSSFMILGQCAFQLSFSQPHGNTYPHIERQTDMYEYSIVR